MKIFFYIVISSVLLTYVPVQLLSVITPEKFIVIYSAIFLSLLVNGLFIHFMSRNLKQAPKFTKKTYRNRTSDRARTRKPNNRNKPKSDNRSPSRKTSNVDNNEELVGTIKWYNRRKSYGFILDAFEEEIFFHHQELELVNGKTPLLDKGTCVKFNKKITDKGPQAQRVRVVE